MTNATNPSYNNTIISTPVNPITRTNGWSLARRNVTITMWYPDPTNLEACKPVVSGRPESDEEKAVIVEAMEYARDRAGWAGLHQINETINAVKAL